MSEPRDDELDQRPPPSPADDRLWSRREIEGPGGWPRDEDPTPDWPRPPGAWGEEPAGWGADAAPWQPEDPWRRDDEPPAWEPEQTWPDEPWPDRRTEDAEAPPAAEAQRGAEPLPWGQEPRAWGPEPAVAEPEPAYTAAPSRDVAWPQADIATGAETSPAHARPEPVDAHPFAAEPPSEPEPEPEWEMETAPGPEPEPEPEPRLEPEPEPQPLPEPRGAAALEGEPGADSEREPAAAPEPGPEPGFDPGVRPLWATRSGPPTPEDSAAGAVPDSGVAPEPPPAPEADGTRPAVSITPPFPEVAAAERERRGPRTTATRVDTRIATPEWQEDLAPRRATLAEQAVPWLIGVILLLAGMVIVLIALIFSSEGGLLGAVGSESPTPSGSPRASDSVVIVPHVSPGASGEVAGASGSAAPSSEPTPTPTPGPQYGALEVTYLARATAADPIQLYRVDFTTTDTAETVATATEGIERFAWTPDGTRGAVLVMGQLIAVVPGQDNLLLASGISAMTFGPDASTVFAVRVTAGGETDTAEVLAVDIESADARSLGTVTYPHPAEVTQEARRAAQFADDGGVVRLLHNEDGRLALRVEGAPVYVFDPAGGEPREVDAVPALYSPDGTRYVALSDDGSSSTLALRGADDGGTIVATTAAGLVSHVRWAPNGSQVVFTLARSDGAGGVFQDLYLWNLDAGAPIQLTSNGASFGAAFLGATEVWRR